MTSKIDIAGLPLLDGPPPADYEPRLVTFQARTQQRRGFLRVLAVGGMALGMTVLGWVPVGRRAEAVAGTEWPSCRAGDFAYDDAIICTPEVYSSYYCGTDKWFKNGCFREPDGLTTCFRPLVRCHSRNAWRWVRSGVTYRCADGEVKCQQCSEWNFKICSARL